MDNQSLAELIIKFQNGDESVFNEIYNATQGKVYIIAKGICKNEEDAQDIMQEAYIYFYQKAQDIKKPESFQSWINMVTANKAKNLLRKNNPVLFNDSETEQFAINSIEDADDDFQPETDLANDELREEVLEMINSLSDEKRIVVMLYYYDRMTTKQISEALEINENTIKSRLVQAKKDLNKKVEELKKKNKSLYGIAPIYLIIWALRSSADTASKAFIRSEESAKILANIKKTAAKANVPVQTATTVATGKLTSKIAGAALFKKIIAGIIAASIVIGSSFGIKNIIKNKKAELENETKTELFATEDTDDSEWNYQIPITNNTSSYKDIEEAMHINIESSVEYSLSVPIPLESEGPCGESCFYKFDKKTGLLIIYGTGPIGTIDTDQISTDSIAFNDKHIKEVVIKDGITYINPELFMNCKNLKKVTIGKDVTTIDTHAFCCTGVENIIIPDNVTRIEASAFEYCTKLQTVQLPNKIEYIGDLVFNGCINLIKVSISNASSYTGSGVIDSAVFQGCQKLIEATLPENTTEFGCSTFNQCINLTTLYISKELTLVYNDAFNNCVKLTDIYYAGNEESWNGITIQEDNQQLLDANIHFSEI